MPSAKSLSKQVPSGEVMRSSVLAVSGFSLFLPLGMITIYIYIGVIEPKSARITVEVLIDALLRYTCADSGALVECCCRLVRGPCSGPCERNLMQDCCCRHYEGPLFRTPSTPYAGLLMQTFVMRGPCSGPQVSRIHANRLSGISLTPTCIVLCKGCSWLLI
jgi:hypothetical protein